MLTKVKVIDEVVPRPHQEICLSVLENVEKQGKNKALVVMASGLGKTITSALFVKRKFIESQIRRCLFLCHQNDILRQAQREFERVMGSEVTYGFFHGEEKTEQCSDIVFASFQTLRENPTRFHPEEFDVIVVDETHHSSAPTYEKIIRYFSPLFLLGITATPNRLDRLDIRDIYGEEVFDLPLSEAVANGLLAPIEYKLMTDEITSLKTLETPNGRMSTKLLNSLIFIPKRDEEIVSIIQSHIESMVEVPKVIIFCSSIEHCERIAELIPRSVPIHSEVSQADRKMRLELFRQGVFQIGVTVDMFNEALDVPETNLVVFLRSTSSPVVYFQQLGRGLRIHKNKEKVTILDFVANCERVSIVHEFWKEVKEKSTQPPRFKLDDENLRSGLEPFSLNIDTIEFQEKVIPIIELIKSLQMDPYETWQEASDACRKLGIEKITQYQKEYKKDPRLPRSLYTVYLDFPGADIFFKKIWNVKTTLLLPCLKWQDASEVIARMKIKSMDEYEKKHTNNSTLPKNPATFYPDYPGDDIFFRKTYQTWQEASEVAKTLGAKTIVEYWEKYTQDPRLPSNPARVYKDFPGVSVFLGVETYKFYPTYKEASDAAQKLGVTCTREYFEKRHEDSMLPYKPNEVYPKDWKNWLDYLGTEREFYSTVGEASKAAQDLKINSWRDYKNNYMKDPKLYSDPDKLYEDFPGWIKFLGKE